jgi:hypothetical protein
LADFPADKNSGHGYDKRLDSDCAKHADDRKAKRPKWKPNIPTSPVQRSAALDRGTFFEDCPSRWFLRIFRIMDEKAYFEFLAMTQNEGPLHFLIEVTGKKSEDPKLRAEDFIYLQHLAGIQRTEGPKNISEEEAEKLHKVEQIATYGDGKVWTVFKNLD